MMTTRRKILIDRLIGLPIVVLLNFPVRVFGRLLRRDHSIGRTNTRHIVVAKFLGMGSIIQATPLLIALKEAYPDAKLIFLTATANAPLIDRLEIIDAALYVNDGNPLKLLWSTIVAIATMVRLRIDHYLDLEVYSAYAAIMSLVSRARNRFGFYRYSSGFKKGFYTHLMYLNTRRPIREVYLQLGRMAGIGDAKTDRLGPLQVNDSDLAALREIVTLSPDVRYLVVNPNASDMMLERRWPLRCFAELIQALAGPQRPVVLIGSKSEAPYVAMLMPRLSASCRPHVINTAGQLPLPQLFALLRDAACVVTNDTGPMHMAIALGAPTVCLFGPVHPGHYGFERSDVAILYRPVFCSPCAHEISEPPCNGDNICMQLIQPADVIAAANRLLGRDVADRRTEPGYDRRGTGAAEPLYVDANQRPLGMVTKSSVREAHPHAEESPT